MTSTVQGSRPQALQTAQKLEKAGVYLSPGMLERVRDGTVTKEDVDFVKRMVPPGAAKKLGAALIAAGCFAAAVAVPAAGVTLISIMIGLATAGIGASVALPMAVRNYWDQNLKALEKADPSVKAEVKQLLRAMESMNKDQLAQMQRAVGAQARAQLAT